MTGVDFSNPQTIVLLVIGILAIMYAVFPDMFKGLTSFKMEGFSDFAAADGSVSSPVGGEEGIGSNTVFKNVADMDTTTSSCYPQPNLTAQDLLPQEDSKAIQDFNVAKPVGEGILKGVNLLDAGFHIGVNTVGQSLRNANQQIRSEPPNPQVQVSPFLNTTIGPDLMRRPLEDGEGCAKPPSGTAPAGAPASVEPTSV